MPFTDEPWESPETQLSASDFCKVCLVDLNPKGAEKVKARCYLPVRRSPGAPYNRNALRAAAAALMGARGGVKIPAAEKRRAARKLVRLMREAGMSVGEGILRLAGMR